MVMCIPYKYIYIHNMYAHNILLCMCLTQVPSCMYPYMSSLYWRKYGNDHENFEFKWWILNSESQHANNMHISFIYNYYKNTVDKCTQYYNHVIL